MQLVWDVAAIAAETLQRYYLVEIDVGYNMKKWATTGTSGLYTHTLIENDPVSVYVDGTAYTEVTSLAACGGTASTWFISRGTALYVHTAADANINTKTAKIETTWHFGREGIIVPKVIGAGSTVFPVFYESRLSGVPRVSYESNPDDLGGGVVPVIGNVALRNDDGYFDSLLPKVIWKNQPARLYVGSSGTLPGDYTLRQSFIVDSPSITNNALNVPARSLIEKIKTDVNQGSTITIISSGVAVTNPAPVVIGPMVGIPAYFTGSSGTVGTYQISSHPVGTVTRVWSSGGTQGTISGNLATSGMVAAYPLASMGQEVIYVNGTGLTSQGTALFKAGEIMQWLLASAAGIPAANIDTAAFSAIDSERPVNLLCWFGRNEAVEDAMDSVARSVFSEWSVGRDNKFSAHLKRNRVGTSNTINDFDFEGAATDWANNGLAQNTGTTIGNSAFSGTRCLQVSRPAGTTGTSDFIRYGTGISVGSNNSYVLTMVGAKQSGDASGVKLGFKDPSGTIFTSSSYSLGTGTWTRMSHSFKPQLSGTGTIYVYPSYNGTLTGTIWMDYVELFSVKPISDWQIQGFEAKLVSPANHQVSIRYTGTGTLTNVPLPIMSPDADQKDTFFTATSSSGTTAAILYSGLERRVVNSLAYSLGDATTLGSAVLAYYSKPRINWTADYLDTQDTTINLWDVLYIQEGRFPGIPEGMKFLFVTSVEDHHDENGVPKTHIGGEYVFDAISDVMNT